MNAKSTKSNRINTVNRCQHNFDNGTRCRLPIADPTHNLCPRHASLHSEPPKVADLRSILAGKVTEFEDAQEVNKFLSNLLILLSEDRISPRRAAVMAYTCNLLLRTLTVHIQELRAYSDDEPADIRIDFGDLPRPQRDPLPTASPDQEPAAPLTVDSLPARKPS